MPLTLNEVIKELESQKCDYVLIDYPTSKKSIDLVVNTKKRKLVIKVSDKAKIANEELNDLKKISVLPSTTPLILTNKAEEDIVIERDGIMGVSLEGLSKIIDGQRLFIYRTRGGIFIKINPKVLKRKRLEMGYSLGDLSKLLGVSRQAVYNYEHGNADVSIEVAEKLIEVFGEEIIGDVIQDYKVSLKENEEDRDFDAINSTLLNKFEESGLKTFRFKKTTIDFLVEYKDKKGIIVLEANSEAETRKKFQEANKIAKLFKLKMLCIINKYNQPSEKEGFKVYRLEEVSELIDEVKRDS
ncbi:MAG: helix-turn-helix domain-containing protein [Sulfolobaceae archaeon]